MIKAISRSVVSHGDIPFHERFLVNRTSALHIAGAYHSGSLVGGANYPTCNNTTEYDNAFPCFSVPVFDSTGLYSVQTSLCIVNQAACRKRHYILHVSRVPHYAMNYPLAVGRLGVKAWALFR